ncbi:hypothetical protein M569_14391, partial [Genlisea aurea]
MEQEIGDGRSTKNNLGTDSRGEDPLLGSGAFIDSSVSENGAREEIQAKNEEEGEGDSEKGKIAIDARPISSYPPQKTPTTKKKSLEEMAKRPSWLPEDWTMDLKIRNSGASKGHIDRYYAEPTGQRRFRSKTEVLHFLESGGQRKRKPTSEANDTTVRFQYHEIVRFEVYPAPRIRVITIRSNAVSPESKSRKKTESQSRKSSGSSVSDGKAASKK